jgi:hypothetical protein
MPRNNPFENDASELGIKPMDGIGNQCFSPQFPYEEEYWGNWGNGVPQYERLNRDGSLSYVS